MPKSRRTQDPRMILPEKIHLPDGREFDVAELLAFKKFKKNHSLLSIFKSDNYGRRYTDEERLWQTTARAEELRTRYGITSAQAHSMRYTARKSVALRNSAKLTIAH